MQVILLEDVEHLGRAGELVTVKSGYGRNYLLPQGMAISATERNKKQLEHEKNAIQTRVARERADAESVAERINMMTLQFERRVGEGDKLFGSVTSKEIAEQLEIAGVKIDHRKIKLSEPVKALGKYETEVKLGSDTVATLKFWVVALEKD